MSTALPPASSSTHSFFERVIGAVRLDATTYDEIEHDPGALGQSAGVVALAGVAAAIGAAGGGGGGAIGAMLGSLLGWLVSTAFIWVVGVYFMKHTSDYKELLRTLGFASAPQLLLVLQGIPGVGGLIAFAATLWSLAALVVAARQALDVTTGQAVWVCILAVVAKIVCIVGLGALFVGLLASSAGGPGAVGF